MLWLAVAGCRIYSNFHSVNTITTDTSISLKQPVISSERKTVARVLHAETVPSEGLAPN
jgi:hypothetical protein